MLKGNKGEWSEVYAFFYLLGEGKMYAADADLQKMDDDAFIPIIRIIRKEKKSPQISYYIADLVDIKDESDEVLKQVHKKTFRTQAKKLFEAIKSSRNAKGAFSIPKTEAFMGDIYMHSIKAPSADKTDITMQIRDVHTGVDPICGWSIKSELGNPPSLLNAGKTTNFIFEAKGLDETDVEEINSINSRSKIKDRLIETRKRGSLTFIGTVNSTFDRNMRLIDSIFPNIMAEAVQLYFLGNGPSCKDIVKTLEKTDPLSLGEGMYEYKFKKFLAASALGMNPSTQWDGHDDATGGYVVVRDDGIVLAFHIYNRNMFEDYLLDNTQFDTGSSNRHDFGYIYKDNNSIYIKLNLQIRFT